QRSGPNSPTELGGDASPIRQSHATRLSPRLDAVGAGKGQGRSSRTGTDHRPALIITSHVSRLKTMGKVTGFLEIKREMAPRRSVDERIRDWFQVYCDPTDELVQSQGARCMDCGIPFCHTGCPLGNIIPDWNDLVYQSRWREAIEVLHKTNNFPEFTGWVCPAPCEASCVL